jgi:hypothetical protein
MISSPNWMDKLCSLMEKYYCCDTRTNVRLKALTVLSSILGSYRYTFEEELIEVIVFPYLLSIHEDNDMTVRAAVTQLLVNLAHHCDMPHFFTIVNAISKVANRDTKLKKDQKSGCWLRETDDIETAIIGLIGLFKVSPRQNQIQTENLMPTPSMCLLDLVQTIPFAIDTLLLSL